MVLPKLLFYFIVSIGWIHLFVSGTIYNNNPDYPEGIRRIFEASEDRVDETGGHAFVTLLESPKVYKLGSFNIYDTHFALASGDYIEFAAPILDLWLSYAGSRFKADLRFGNQNHS